MKWKKWVLIGMLLVLVGAVGTAIMVYRSEKTQLNLQVGATSHVTSLLSLLPKNVIDQEAIEQYSAVFDAVLANTDIKVIDHMKKTGKTGVATLEVLVPIIDGQLMNAILTTTNADTVGLRSQIGEENDMDLKWLMEIAKQEIPNIELDEVDKKTLRLDVPTYAMKGNIWSFSLDALDDVALEVLHGMGLDKSWRTKLYDALP